MGASKRLYEQMIGKYQDLEAKFNFLEQEQLIKCSRCDEMYHSDFMHYSDYPDHALCEHCNHDINT